VKPHRKSIGEADEVDPAAVRLDLQHAAADACDGADLLDVGPGEPADRGLSDKNSQVVPGDDEPLGRRDAVERDVCVDLEQDRTLPRRRPFRAAWR
jgi:hypothetical protein